MDKHVVLVTGARKGIGRRLAEHYLDRGSVVIGCSRGESDLANDHYTHYSLDVSDESAAKKMFKDLRKTHGRLDVLINNAGIASMNHSMLTTLETVHKVLDTNVVGTFLFCREAAKIMQKKKFGRIVNFTTVAVPLKLEGEAVYAASKAAVISLTQILSREMAEMGITVNALGPTPVKTDLVAGVPPEKLDDLIARQAIKRYGDFRDITNVIDFFIRPESDFITGQVIFLGGI